MNPTQDLWINFDGLKEFGFDVILFYVKSRVIV